MPTESQLDNVRSKLATETGLTEVVTIRKDGRPLVSVVNAGVIDHPSTGQTIVALVSRGNAARLAHLRESGQITIAIRRGWDWVGVDGTVELAGPNDAHPAIDPSEIPELLQEIFKAAGGTHDDYEEYDRAMAEDERTAVLITPTKIYGNDPTR